MDPLCSQASEKVEHILHLFADHMRYYGEKRLSAMSGWFGLRVTALVIGANAVLAASTDSLDGPYHMSKLIKRLDKLENTALDSLLGFYEPRLHTFCAKAEDLGRKDRVCITSSCYALLTLTLANSGNVYDHLISFDDEKDEVIDNVGDDAAEVAPASSSPSASRDVVSISQVLKSLLDSSWRDDDLFQAPLLLYTLLKIDTDQSLIRSNPQCGERIGNLISSVLKARPHRHHGLEQESSEYVIYQVCKVVSLLRNSSASLPPIVLPQNFTSEIFWALLRCAEGKFASVWHWKQPFSGCTDAAPFHTVSSNELCRQLAYRTASDSASFDVVRLAYSLLTYLKSTESLSGIAGKELVAGAGPAPETKVVPLNNKLVKAALVAFFEEQSSNGMWPRGQPIYKSSDQERGRHVGNAFVFPVNTVGSLLCVLPAEYFRPHLSALERTLSWIETHQTREMVTTFIDPQSGQCYGKTLRGWRSPHLDREEGPSAWSTAQTLKCITWLKIRIQQLMHNDVLEEFSGVRYSEDGVQPTAWDRLLDSDLGDSSQDTDCRTIKSVLKDRIIRPFSPAFNNPLYGA